MTVEALQRFDCFGGACVVAVGGRGPAGSAPEAARRARALMCGWHTRFSRFDAASELSALNRDPRTVVEVSPTLARLLAAAVAAAELTGGLVDPTLGRELADAGYARSRQAPDAPPALRLDTALDVAPPRTPARCDPRARWRAVTVDLRRRTVTRPSGLTLDLGGIAKGVVGDVLASVLAGHHSFAVDAAGDLRLGGRGAVAREIRIAGPDGDGILHTLQLRAGAVATSGIGRRSWREPVGAPAHHLLDPSSGRPAFTGLVQVTALAPTGAEAEARAKAALLAGPDGAATWLVHGGVVVPEHGAPELLPAPTVQRREALAA